MRKADNILEILPERPYISSIHANLYRGSENGHYKHWHYDGNMGKHEYSRVHLIACALTSHTQAQ